MPNRVVREGILTSERVEQLDPAVEVFYRRLMSKVDDFGLYDARPSILRSSLFPLRVDRVREADISRWIAACEKAGLLVLYTHNASASSSRRIAACEMAGLAVAEKPYLQMLDTKWQTRSEPKYPLPPDGNRAQPPPTENSCSQVQAIAPVFGVVVEDVDEGVSARKRARTPPKVPLPAEFGISDRVRTWAAKHGFGQLNEHLEAFRRKCAAHGYAYRDHDAAFMEAIREDWAKLRGRTQNGASPPGEQTGDNGAAERSAAYLREQAEAAARAVPPPAAVVERLKAAGITLRKAAA